jgi:hypothetical protein
MTIAWTQIVIGGLVVIGFFGILGMLLFRPENFNELNREPIMLMVGALIAAFSGLMGFFFGSSAGSTRKESPRIGEAPRRKPRALARKAAKPPGRVRKPLASRRGTVSRVVIAVSNLDPATRWRLCVFA